MSFNEAVRFIGSTIIAGALVLIPFTAKYLIGSAQSLLTSFGIKDWPENSYKFVLFIVIWMVAYLIFSLFLRKQK